MTNRKKLPEGCFVSAFSSTLPSRGTDLGVLGDRTQARHRQLGSTSWAPLVGALRPRLVWTPGTTAAATESPRVRIRRQPRWHQHGVPQELFRDALARECRRADRFGHPFVLLLVELNSSRPSGLAGDVTRQPSSAWRKAVEALTAAVGETAVLGWFEKQTVFGAIVPDTNGSDQETVFRRELASRLDTDEVAGFSISSHVYSPSGAVPPDERNASDPFLIEWRSPSRAQMAYHAIKRGLDFAGSLALLLLMSPIFFVIAVLLKLTSPGPVLFRQARVGRMGKPFTMLKFRSMRVDADHKLHQEFVSTFIKSSTQSCPKEGETPEFKLTKDPRVTPIGRLLRKTSLDELPQLLNVLRGDMSLVGPRPPLSYEVEQYRPWHWRRVLEAKPGLTGLWQVYGRSRTTFDDMVRLDIRYIRTCSLRNDVKILLATPRAVISGTGAH